MPALIPAALLPPSSLLVSWESSQGQLKALGCCTRMGDPDKAPVSWLPNLSFSSLLVSWESSRGWSKALGPCTHVGDLEEVPGSWLWFGAAPAVELTWGMNHPPLCISAFPIKINKYFSKTLITLRTNSIWNDDICPRASHWNSCSFNVITEKSNYKT